VTSSASRRFVLLLDLDDAWPLRGTVADDEEFGESMVGETKILSITRHCNGMEQVVQVLVWKLYSKCIYDEIPVTCPGQGEY